MEPEVLLSSAVPEISPPASWMPPALMREALS